MGTFYYWSGLVDSNTISFRGIVEVVDGNNKDLDINVKLNGVDGKNLKHITLNINYIKANFGIILAQKCAFPFTYNGNTYTSCTNVDQSFSWCSPTSTYSGQILTCDTTSKFEIILI